MPHPLVESRQGSYFQSQNVEELAYIGLEPTVRRGSVRVAKEPEVVNTNDQAVDDLLAAYVIIISSKRFLTRGS